MSSDMSRPGRAEQLRQWEYQRPDGYVFHCDLMETARDWVLTLACNDYVFAKQAFDSRLQAEAWARDFWQRLTSVRAQVPRTSRLRAA